MDGLIHPWTFIHMGTMTFCANPFRKYWDILWNDNYNFDLMMVLQEKSEDQKHPSGSWLDISVWSQIKISVEDRQPKIPFIYPCLPLPDKIPEPFAAAASWGFWNILSLEPPLRPICLGRLYQELFSPLTQHPGSQEIICVPPQKILNSPTHCFMRFGGRRCSGGFTGAS